MIADLNQRVQALDPTRSFIVEAPAGSGKTGLLVQRYLRLLSLVERPESIVAVTFTRKAAAEMKERILKALADAAAPQEILTQDYQEKTRELATAVLAQDQRRHWKLLEDPSHLQIQTIDSLCALLTRQMPVLSEFGGVGEVIEQASELYLSAAREMLTTLAEGNQEQRDLFRRMVLHFDNDVSRLETQIVNMLSKRDQWEHLNPAADQQLVQDCCAVLHYAEEQLRLVFQRAGKVDFTEIARAARRALGKPEQPSDLLFSLDYRLQHLLVDEFQDTSRSQYELVRALTEQWSLGDDHTLFLVGDPMQSIYRFREADVSLFLKCWKDRQIGGVQLTPLRLQTNFRTTVNVLNWVEENFAPMMPADDEQHGAVEFRRSFSGRGTKGAPPRVIAHIDDKGGEEAQQIIDIVERSRKNNKRVAILVRSRAQTAHILPALRRAEIPYEAIDIELLKDQQHIIDILSLTRALTNVADRVSWLACLRAPWCGLTLKDLSILAEGKRDRTILDLLSDPETIGALPVESRWRAIRVQEILADAVARVGRSSLRDLVEQIWQMLGGRAVIQEPNQGEDVSTLLRLIGESEEGGIVRDFSLLNAKLEFLFARPAVSDSGVVVMTIYQAKGLEFDVVILPQLDRKVRGYEPELLVWAEREDQNGLTELAIAAIPQTGVDDSAYKEITDIAKNRDDNESRRLFYVACTRAIDELYLIGSVGTKDKGMQVKLPSSGTFLRLLWDNPQVEADFTAVLHRQKLASQTSFAFPNPPQRILLRRLPTEWHPPRLAQNIPIGARVRRATASRREVSYHWVSDTRRHVGTIVHRLLNQIATDGVHAWSPARIISSRPLVESELLLLGVPSEEKKSAAQDVLRAVANALKSERGNWILSAHAGARSEWAIAGPIGGSLVTGAIDRSFTDEQGTCWIIDFKTGPHDGSNLNEFLANEKERYQPQLEQYAALVSRLVNVPIKLGLYFPLLDAWVQWQPAEALTAPV